MGQATLDLPDPLEQPDSSRPKSADDLLSQLAGEEIDRMLSDSGALESNPHETPEGAAPLEAASAPDPFEPPTEVKAAPVDAAKEAISAEAAVAAQLDDLFDQINGLPAAEEKAPSAIVDTPAITTPELAPHDQVAVTAADLDAALVAGTGPLLPPLAPGEAEDQAAANERAALSASADAIAAVGDEAEAQADADPDRLPIFLKPLEWINAPLAYCPESVREAFGKVAILTLFNSLAVLIYVLIFRRHH